MKDTLVFHIMRKLHGITDGTTRLSNLFEEPGDEEEVRIRFLSSPKIVNIVSPRYLEVREESLDALSPNSGILLNASMNEVIEAINSFNIPHAWLTNTEQWREICWVRGKRGGVDPEAWSELCRVRGYLLYRRNSRGY